MKTLDTQDLSLVSGGLSKTDQVSTALTQIQSSIKDVATQNNNGGNSTTTMMLMGMMMSQRSAPTVIAAPAAAAGPVVNISTRVRRGW